MSGVTITDTDSAGVFTSACGGVTIPLTLDPDNIDTTAMMGTDCVTLITRPYNANLGNSIANGPQTITLSRATNLLLDDLFAAANGVNISADSPAIGGPWTQRDMTNNIICDGAGQATMGGPGTTRYTAPYGGPSPEMGLSLLLHADTGWSNNVEIGVRWDEAALTGYVLVLSPPNLWVINSRVAGVDTPIASATFTMPQLVDPPIKAQLIAFGTSIQFRIDNAVQGSVTDSSIVPAGEFMTGGSRSVGQPVLYTEARGEAF